MKLGFLLTNTAALTETWTTTHLVQAALLDGHHVRLMEPWSHEVTDQGRLVARAWAVDEPVRDRAELIRRIRGGSLPRRFVDVAHLDLMLIRVNPMTGPALQLALLAQEAGVAVINDPMGISLTRSKAWLATLPDVPIPRTLVTGSRSSAEAFADQHRDQTLVVKPALGSGGRGVSLVPPGRRDRLERALQAARANGSGHVVLQRYLEEASEGEKRLVWVDGVLLGAYLRQRQGTDFRHNLKQGGLPTPCSIDERDRHICDTLSPHLTRNGIRIAGLDVIGGRLVEVNTLNPGGLHWSDALGATPGQMAARAIALLTSRVQTDPPPPHEARSP